MSTNFYLRTGDDDTQDQHIGKRSVGWVFTFNAQVNKTYDDWMKALLNMAPGQFIMDEYNRPYSVEEFVEEVQATLKPWNGSNEAPRGYNASIYHPEARQERWMDRGFMFSNYEFC